MKLKRSHFMVLVLAWGMAGSARATQEDGMTITGDQELPSVLYVLPWRSPTLEPVREPALDNPALAPLGPCDTGPGVEPLPGCSEKPSNARVEAKR